MNRPLLRVDRVARSFRGRPILREASLQVTPGQITALMGRNGVGKTTVFRVAVGRVRSSRGHVLWDGARVRPTLPGMARRGVFHADQDSLLTRGFTIAQHVDALCTVYGDDRKAEAVDAMDMGSYLARHPSRVSGGERQRATLGMALMRRPRVLLMDEPFAGTSPMDRERIAGGLDRLRREGCGVAVSGHDVEDLLAVADEVVWLHDGITRFLGAPGSARADPAFQREYLGRSGGDPDRT